MRNLIRTLSWRNKKPEARPNNAFCRTSSLRIIVRYESSSVTLVAHYKILNLDNFYDDKCAPREEKAPTKAIIL